MSKIGYSRVNYRIAPFLFKHSTIIEMFHLISSCASSVGHDPNSVYLLDQDVDQIKQMNYDFCDQKSEILNYLFIHYKTIAIMQFSLEAEVRNGSQKIPYTVTFNKSTHDHNNSVIMMAFDVVHLSGLHLDTYINQVREDAASEYEVLPHDDFVDASFDIYQLVKVWMNVLKAEECWGGDATEWFEPDYEGYHYKHCYFRFRRNGPQYVDISLEDRTPYTCAEADEKMRQELRLRGYDEEKIRSHIELWAYGRIVDATWDKYYQIFNQGIKPPMRYADEAELYENPDALFGDIKARAIAHGQLQEKLKSGEINFDDGFMTVD